MQLLGMNLYLHDGEMLAIHLDDVDLRIHVQPADRLQRQDPLRGQGVTAGGHFRAQHGNVIHSVRDNKGYTLQFPSTRTYRP